MNWKLPQVYAVKHIDEAVRAESRSGGVFTALTDKVFEKNGIVYGCVLTDDFNAVHTRAESAEKRDLMRGSKYIQSRLGNAYLNVGADLKAGRKVLFSGTSCQVAGLKKYLNTEYANLLCVDIVCHGVPSPKVWKEYLHWQEKKHHSRVVGTEFRNKKDFGWKDHVETLTLGNRDVVNSRVFTNLFYGHNILRPSCYECPYKDIMHPGDITIADYWGIEKAAPDFDDNKGVSLVLINSEKGASYFEQVKDNIVWKSTRIEDSMQPPLKAPFPKPENRTEFWEEFSRKSFDYIARKYGDAGVRNKVKRGLRKLMRKLVGK